MSKTGQDRTQKAGVLVGDRQEQVERAIAEGRLEPEISKSVYKKLTPSERMSYDEYREAEIAGVLRVNAVIDGILRLEADARNARRDAAEIGAAAWEDGQDSGCQ
jgi:hypothetical protein